MLEYERGMSLGMRVKYICPVCGRDDGYLMSADGKIIGCTKCCGVKPKTNADRIRSMSDEDLADFIYDKTEDGSYKAWLEWLKREASDGKV